jgi:hypothetical protein
MGRAAIAIGLEEDLTGTQYTQYTQYQCRAQVKCQLVVAWQVGCHLLSPP